MDYYSLVGVPKRFPSLMTPGAFTCRSSTLTVFVDLTRFVDYYSPFWGPEAISMVVEPQGALKCRSSTIAVWADSGPFLGLLLSYAGSELTPGCVYVSVSNTHNFGQF